MTHMGHSYLHLRYNTTIFRYCENTHLCSKYTNMYCGDGKNTFSQSTRHVEPKCFKHFWWISKALVCISLVNRYLHSNVPNPIQPVCIVLNATRHITTGRQLPTYFTYRSCPAMETHTMKLSLQSLC